MNVLKHHDRIVDHDADGEDQSQHREIVQREIHHTQQRKRRDNRSRNGDGGDERTAPVVQKCENGQCHENRAEHQMKADLVHRAIDEDRLVPENRQFKVGRNYP